EGLAEGHGACKLRAIVRQSGSPRARRSAWWLRSRGRSRFLPISPKDTAGITWAIIFTTSQSPPARSWSSKRFSSSRKTVLADGRGGSKCPASIRRGKRDAKRPHQGPEKPQGPPRNTYHLTLST